MRDGYSDDGVKWDNVKLFLKTEEKPFNRVSGSDSRTWALAGSSRGDIFLQQKDKKNAGQAGVSCRKTDGINQDKIHCP
ncbi:hypothetical protein DSM2777_01015 [Obesumbacterium proteus]|nr:hypothetical protein DSM2777_01015 [Obesumbacterium proteus]